MARLREQLSQEVEPDDSDGMIEVKICYYLKKELGIDITDEYPWMRYKYYVDCMKDQAKLEKEELEKVKQ